MSKTKEFPDTESLDQISKLANCEYKDVRTRDLVDFCGCYNFAAIIMCNLWRYEGLFYHELRGDLRLQQLYIDMLLHINKYINREDRTKSLIEYCRCIVIPESDFKSIYKKLGEKRTDLHKMYDL